MTNLETIRRNIGDQPVLDIQSFYIKDVNITKYKLNNAGANQILEVTRTRAGVATTLNNTQYTLDSKYGKISFNAGVLALDDFIYIEYEYAFMSDTEINDALTASASDTSKASVMCVDWMIANAAKLHDYKSGSEDMSLSQIVSNLKTLRGVLTSKIEEANTASSTPILVDLTRPASENDNPPVYYDLSREL